MENEIKKTEIDWDSIRSPMSDPEYRRMCESEEKEKPDFSGLILGAGILGYLIFS